MNVMVVGGAGFIGSHVVRNLEDEGHDVTVFDVKEPEVKPSRVEIGNVENLNRLQEATEGHDLVYHLAGPVRNAFRRDPYSAAKLEQQGTLNVLEACRHTSVEKVLYASSFYVYDGIPEDRIVNEATVLDVMRMELFGAAKYGSERLVRAYEEKHNLDWVIFRFGSAYGWGDCTNVIKTFMEMGAKGETIDVWGPGERRNQYTYVEDIADGCVRALDRSKEVFNLISPEETTTGELAGILRGRFDFEIIFDETKEEGPSMAHMSSRKAQEILGWEPTPVERGIERVAQAMEADSVL